MINIARQVQFLVSRIVMISKKIVRFDNFHIVYLRRPQNFLRALRAGDVRARPHLAPFSERAGHPNLRPNSKDQWHADVEQPVRSKTETVWVKHVEFNLTRQSELSLCRRVIRRRETLRVHLQQGAAASHPPTKYGSRPDRRSLKSDQISNCLGNRDRILQPVFLTKTTTSKRTPPSPG